jgi:hypothetical protein
MFTATWTLFVLTPFEVPIDAIATDEDGVPGDASIFSHPWRAFVIEFSLAAPRAYDSPAFR